MTDKPNHLDTYHRYMATIHTVPYSEWSELMKTEYAIIILAMQRTLSEQQSIPVNTSEKLLAILERADEVPAWLKPIMIDVAREGGLIH